jgi:hypothetical protein
LVDVQSRFMWNTLLMSKSDTAIVIKQVQCRVEAECDRNSGCCALTGEENSHQ